MALICARGGSKGVPGKNIRESIKPLIAWSIEQALRCSFSDRVVVSTDSEKIARIAIKHLAHVPFIRPRELAMDDSPEWAVWQHALREMDASENFRPDYVVVLPPTSPFRSTGDIANGLEKLRDADTDIVIGNGIREKSLFQYGGAGSYRLRSPQQILGQKNHKETGRPEGLRHDDGPLRRQGRLCAQVAGNI